MKNRNCDNIAEYYMIKIGEKKFLNNVYNEQKINL